MPAIRQKHPRVSDRGYLSFIHDLPCIVTGRRGEGVQGAHVRYGSIPHGKRDTGAGEKPDDRWVVPLWHEEHADQHAHGERGWWQRKGIDPLCVAALIYSAYHAGDIAGAEAVCINAKEIALWMR